MAQPIDLASHLGHIIRELRLHIFWSGSRLLAIAQQARGPLTVFQTLHDPYGYFHGADSHLLGTTTTL